jgi:hypothetical protein
MKKITLLFATVLFGATFVMAQNDTLLYEDFSGGDTILYMNVGAPAGTPTFSQWYNFDYDGIADANGRPQEWFASLGFAEDDTSEIVYMSSSWLSGFDPGNLNYLITPAIYISDANATLYWRSCPRQTPSYLDGYRVAVSTTNNLETSFSDTIFKAAEFAPSGSAGGPGAPAVPAFSDYPYGEGWIHGWDGSGIVFSGDSGSWIGTLVDHSVSLSAYQGETIYLAFIHTSADDNLIAVDDILVMGTGNASIEDNDLNASLNVFPNPATDMISVDYTLNKTAEVVVEITDVTGKEILHENRGVQIAGQHAFDHDVTNLPAGTYTISINTNDNRATKTFVKQ